MAKEKIEVVPAHEDERLGDREDYVRVGDSYGDHEMSTLERERAAEMTDPERRRSIRARWSEGVLPDLPPINGWHRCWVSTTHPIDTPQKRKRYGYRFVKYDDINALGWSADVDAVKEGQDARSRGGKITLEQGVEDMRRRMNRPPAQQFES
jgi:hypothetical protein